MADKSARPAPGDEMIILENLYKRFGHVVAVGGVNLRVASGEVVVIVGPSGSGKSTVLRCINLLEVPTEGDVWVDGFHLTAKKPDDQRGARGGRHGVPAVQPVQPPDRASRT